ncbi:MAG: heparinase, partial [Bacteroidales bacterium]|nr:heparinase [Bacteroidales bacterium]
SLLKPMGVKNGYQHLWNTAHSSEINGLSSVTWLNDYRFYTCSFLADENSEVFLTRIGANDPEFNLRNEPGILFRQNKASNYRFLSLYEAHGSSNSVLELVEGTKSSLKELSFLLKNDDVNIVRIVLKDGTIATLGFSVQNDENAEHQYNIEDETFKWTGNSFMAIVE